jgi:hypothetical protein
MVDSTNANNWLAIRADKSWEAHIGGHVYQSTATDSIGKNPTKVGQVDVKDATAITVDGSPAPASVQLVARVFDSRDKARVTMKNIDGQTDVKFVDPASPVDAHAFNCGAIFPS